MAPTPCSKIHFPWESLLSWFYIPLPAGYLTGEMDLAGGWDERIWEREESGFIWENDRKCRPCSALVLSQGLPSFWGALALGALPVSGRAHVKPIKSVRKGSTTVGNHFVWVSKTCA